MNRYDIIKLKRKFQHLFGFHKIILSVKNWLPFLLNYMSILKTSNLYILTKKMKFFASHEEIGTIVNIFIEKEYGTIEDKDQIIIDIGAHIGIFSIYATQNKKAKIYAFEPSSKNFKILKRNIKLNKCEENIRAFNEAVTNKRGEVKLFQGESSVLNSAFLTSNFLKKEIVKSTTLEKIFIDNRLKKVDILKIDCEGSEYDILYSSPIQILNKIKSIRMEYHNLSINKTYNRKKLIKFLLKRGFCLTKFIERGPNYGILWFNKFNLNINL